MSKSLSPDPIPLRFIEEVGKLTQSFGLGRAIGQIYAYVYFSREPRSLADMQETLGISKGNASTNGRQLEQWGAVRKVWVKGDRKDYYEASDWFGQILKAAVVDTVAKKFESYDSVVSGIEKNLQSLDGDGDTVFLRDRIKALRDFQKKALWIWSKPAIRTLLR